MPDERSDALDSHRGSATDRDWRAFENGTPVVAIGATSLPAIYDYQEGLQQFEVTPSVWLRTLTVARSGEGNASQHIIAQRSTDAGSTWSNWFDVEPEGPPPSSYGGFFRHPVTGRVGFMYTLGPATDPALADGRPFYGHRHHIGKITYRYVSTTGEFSERHMLALPLRAVDLGNVFKGKHTLHYGHPQPRILIGDDGYGWYTKLGPEPLVSNGEAFVVRYVGYAHNDAIEDLELELLPHGDHGMQPPDAACICGISPISIADDDWYLKFRSTTGYAGLAETHDRGQTWRVGNLVYAPGGRPVKSPEGPFGLVHDHRDRTYLTFYNDSYSIGFGSFAARDLVYISHVSVTPDGLVLSQPELLYYRRDQGGYERHSRKRLNPPRVIVEDGEVFGQGSDKLTLRRFLIPESFFEALANQALASAIPEDGLLLDDAASGARRVAAPQLPMPGDGRGFTLTLEVRVDEARPRQVLLDGMRGRGIRVLTWRNENLLFAMSDGSQTVRLASDVGSLSPAEPSLRKGAHYVSIIVDGHPGLVSIVVDGVLQDGGAYRERGTVRFASDYGDVNGASHWQVGGGAGVSRLCVHGRALLTSEVVGLHRALATDMRR